jgi:hypothetical protein
MSVYEKDAVTVGNQPSGNWFNVCAAMLTGFAIISSAFHFWPFNNSKAWQMLCPQNFVAFIWLPVLAVYILSKHNRQTVTSLLPHLSVFAYLSFNVLSIAFAPDMERAVSFTAKLALMLVGGYTLFSSAIFNMRSLKMLYNLMTTAVMISIFYCLVVRFGLGSEEFGFHSSAYKYGTYVGILAPLCAAYFLTSSKSWKISLGIIIAAIALVSSGSLGALAAISAGMLAALMVIPRWSTKFYILCSIAFGIGGLLIISNSDPASHIFDDLKLSERDEVNLKQRYIEWQAEINLLEERTITGTAAGCINDYRSNFYYRLPKLNTLKPFDQNGWLATGAETGILGLVCFCWIMLHYGRLALIQIIDSILKESNVDHKFAVANFVGLIAACIANLFSSVHYNGILIVFVLLLALISRTRFLRTK